jgi:hypothetical protein
MADKDKNRKLYAFAEVVSYAPEARKITPLSVVQTFAILFFFVSFVFTLLEVQHVRFMNVYLFTICYTVVGGVIVVAAQLVAYLLYMVNNRHPGGKKSKSTDTQTYMGTHHTRELNLGWVFSILAFLVNCWVLFNWLDRFGKTCTDGCKASQSAPSIGVDPEWTVFYGAFEVACITNFLAIYALLRSLFAHFNPLRAVTHLINEMNSKANV